jgi:RNA polymerase sigma-70 factor (ECF subfamily)
MTPELDAPTLRRAQRGDRAAQETFLRRYVGPLHALIRRSGAPGDADDLTQELMHKLLVVLPRFDAGGSALLTTWVFTIAHRWLVDRRRQKQLLLAPLDESAQVASSGPAPDAALGHRQLAAALEEAIGALPIAQRRVFVLAEVHEHPLQQVADVEGVPLGTIKSRLHRARAFLVQYLGPAFEEDGGRHGSTRRA